MADELPGWMGHEIRRLNRVLKQVNKTMGRQGQTIYDLRCQVEELRAMISKENRGYYRRLETALAAKEDHLKVLREEIDRLREKLEEK
jgi:septal ring factor EnvC (AmiA/AmiB activator)